MKKLIIFLNITIAFLFSFSCKDSSTDTKSLSMHPYNIKQIRNVPWRLTQVTMGDSSVNLNEYRKFYFLFGDTSIFGDDGCNYYYGRFVLDNDIFIIFRFRETALACLGKEQFDAFQLRRQWRIEISDTSIVMNSNDTTFQFTSHFTKSLRFYSFIDKIWKLSASNDTTFHHLSSHKYFYKLELTRDREFNLKEYFITPDSIAFCKIKLGMFGIGDGQSIFFYRHSWSAYCTPNFISSGREFHTLIGRMFRSTHFTVSDTTFTLKNQSDDTYYYFITEE